MERFGIISNRSRLSVAVLVLAGTGVAAESVHSNRDIRPVLAAKCRDCHGPDDDMRKVDLRLDTRTGTTKTLSGHARWFRESRMPA